MRSAFFFVICATILIGPIASGATVKAGSNLQAAIDQASFGDTLLVEPGTYDKIVIKKELELIGNSAIIRAGDRDACVSIEADGVSFSGFVVRDGFYGIKLSSVKGCTIANNTVVYCTQPGIALLFSDGNTITGNNASFNGLGGEGWYGIYLSNSNDNLIANNEAYGNGAYGINLFPSCSNNTIINNILQGNMYGIYMFRDCANNLIESNDMSKNTNSGMDMRFNCTNNLILNNTIEKNVVAGLTFMEDSGRNIVKGNLIRGNKRYGLQVQSGSDGNTIIYNNISDSQTGLFIESSNSLIYGNRIVDNIIQAEDVSENFWYAEYPKGGNLWSDYSAQDEMQGPNQEFSGKDGFGDKPYEITERSIDKYPVMGNQTEQISIIARELSSGKARVGDSISIKAKLKSKYELSQVTVRAYQHGLRREGYARLTSSEDFYQGAFSTALLDPGKYDLVLSAIDSRGYELKEKLGDVEVTAKRGNS